MKNISVRISQSTQNMIKEIKQNPELKKWEPTTSDIIRVAIAYYWEKIIFPEEKTNK